MLDADTLVVVFVSTDPYTRRYDLDIIAEIRASSGEDAVTVLSTEPIPDDSGPPWSCPASPVWTTRSWRCPTWCSRSTSRCSPRSNTRKTPDNPFPSGEVNRVVKGVTIYPMTHRGGDRRWPGTSGSTAAVPRPPSRSSTTTATSWPAPPRRPLLLQRRLRRASNVSCAQGVDGSASRRASTPADIDYAFFGIPGYGEASDDIAASTPCRGGPRPRPLQLRQRHGLRLGRILAGEDGINVISGTGSMTYGERAGHRAPRRWLGRAVRRRGLGLLDRDAASTRSPG